MSTHTIKQTAGESSQTAASGEFPALSGYRTREQTDVAHPGFSGTCEATSLFDWLQLVHLGRRDARMTIQKHDGERGFLWCREGDLIDAECEGLRGEAAVYRALGWSSGDVSLDFTAFERERVIHVGTMELLLQAAVRADSGIRELAPESQGAVPSTLRAGSDPQLEAAAPIQSAALRKTKRRRLAAVFAAALSLACVAAWFVGNGPDGPEKPLDVVDSATVAVTPAPVSPAAGPGATRISLSDTPPGPAPLSASKPREARRSRALAAPARPAAPAVVSPQPQAKPPREEARELGNVRAAVRVIDDVAPRVQVIDDQAPRVEVIQ